MKFLEFIVVCCSLCLLPTITNSSPQQNGFVQSNYLEQKNYHRQDSRNPFLVRCCDNLYCDERTEFCDRITTTNPQRCDCLSCRAYEKLASVDGRYRNTFKDSCQTYIEHTNAMKDALQETSISKSNIRQKLHEMANSNYQQGDNSKYPSKYIKNERILERRSSHELMEANWTLSEKNLLLFLTKLHLFMTGVIIALIVFLVGSKVKRIRRSRRSYKVKWDGSTAMCNQNNSMYPAAYDWSNLNKMKEMESDYVPVKVDYKPDLKIKSNKIDKDNSLRKSNWKPTAECQPLPSSPAPLPAPGTIGVGKSGGKKATVKSNTQPVTSHATNPTSNKSHHAKLHLDVPQKQHNHYSQQPQHSSTSGFNNTMSASVSRNTVTGTLSRNKIPPQLVSSVGDVGQLSSFTEASSNYSDHVGSSITEPSLSLSPGESEDLRLLAEIQRGTALHPNSANFSPSLMSSPKHNIDLHKPQPSRFNFDEAAITSYT